MTVPVSRSAATLAVVALVITAGCIGNFGGGNGAADSPPSIDKIPGSADLLASYDADVVSDPATTEVINTLLEETVPEDSDQPRSLQGLFEQAQNETTDTNLSPSAISGATAFMEYPQMGSMMGGGSLEDVDPYVGVILRTSWSEEDVLDQVESSGEDVEEETYEGTTIYTQEQESMTVAFAFYGENLMVVGSQDAVEDALDVSAGREEAVSGDLREAYESTRSDAYVRFATVIPEQYRELATSGAGGGMGAGSVPGLSNLTAVSGAYYTEGGQDGTVGMAIHMRLDAEEPADQMETAVDSGLGLLSTQVENETIRDHLDRINVSRDSTQVTIRYESPVDEITTAIDQFADDTTFPMGPGLGGSSVERAPQVSFDYDYEGDTLTVTHQGGDTVEGENLRVTCGGPVLDVPDERIQAGDTVVETTECDPGDTLRIVYSGEDTQSILGEYEIPESAGSGARLVGATGLVG